MATEQNNPARELEWRAYKTAQEVIMLQYPDYIKYHKNDGYKLQQKVNGEWVDFEDAPQAED